MSALLLVFTLVFVSAGHAAEPIRIAILSGEGERAPSEELVALVEVAASEQDGVTLLERAEIRKILREQSISASGLANPRTAIRLGELLSVEMFIFLDNVPKSKPPACRIQVIETRTGIALAGSIEEQQRLIDTPEDVTKMIQLALAKQRVPMDQRRYVSILGVHNEEPGQLLDGLAAAFEMFLSVDLAKATEIILLDREHLRQLREEKNLTAIEQQLRTSTTLIEGSLRRADEVNKLTMKLAFRALSNGAAVTRNLSLSQSDISAARSQVIAAVTREMKASAPPVISAAPEAEASLFLKQARFLHRNGYPDDALRAMETAYALNPTVETRLALARYLPWFVVPRHLFGRASEHEKIRSLRTDMRRLSLMCEQYRRTYPLEEDPAHPREVPASGNLVAQHTGLGLVFSEETGEVRRLQQEVADLQRIILEHFVAYSEKDFESRQGLYCDAVRHALGELRLGDRGHAESKIQGLRQILQYFTNPPGKIKDEPGEADNLISNIVDIPERMQAYRAGGKSKPKDRAAFVNFFREMQSHPKIEIRLMAYGAFVCMDEDALASAWAVREIVLTEYSTPKVPRRAKHVLMHCVMRVAAENPAELSHYCEPLIGPCLAEGGDSSEALRWGSIIGYWLEGLERSDRFQEADAVAVRTLDALRELQKQRPGWNPTARNKLMSQLEVKRFGYAEKLNGDAKLPEPWSQYVLKPLPLEQHGARISTVTLAGDRLYCVCRDRNPATNAHTGRLLIYRFPEGGEPLTEVPFDLPSVKPDSTSRYSFRDTAVSADAFYIGIGHRGLIEIQLATEEVRYLTEADGLPSDNIRTLAWCDGELYMGFGSPDLYYTTAKNGFAAFDPKTCQSRILTNSADRASRGLVKIVRLVADTKRHCIWIGSTDYGLYRYDPKTDTMQRKVKTGGYAMGGVSKLQPLPENGEGLLLSGWPVGFVLFDLETCETTWLAGEAKHQAWGCKGAPLMPAPSEVGPAVYYEGDLITANPYLTILSPGLPEAPNPKIIRPHPFIVTPHGVFMTARGKTMLLQKKHEQEIAQE